jgi:hypothetical protein
MKLKTLNLLAVLLIFCFALPLFADEQWEAFKQKSDGYYYHLSSPDVENFTCLFSSSAYINYVRQLADSTFYYPLKLIWTREGKIWFILQPYPDMTDANMRQRTLQQIQMVREQFRGFFLDWQNFIISSPFEDIPEDGLATFSGDSVKVSYTSGEGQLQTSVTKCFLPSGKLYRVVVKSGSQKIVNHPQYSEVNNKWLCIGWDTQIYANNVVSSGMSTRIDLNKIEGHWMPVRVETLVQSTQKPGEKFLSTIYLKDFLFNIPLQEIGSPQNEKQEKPAPQEKQQ